MSNSLIIDNYLTGIRITGAGRAGDEDGSHGKWATDLALGKSIKLCLPFACVLAQVGLLTPCFEEESGI